MALSDNQTKVMHVVGIQGVISLDGDAGLRQMSRLTVPYRHFADCRDDDTRHMGRVSVDDLLEMLRS